MFVIKFIAYYSFNVNDKCNITLLINEDIRQVCVNHIQLWLDIYIDM